MRKPPKHMIATDAIKAWQIHASIYMTILWILIIGGMVLSHIFKFHIFYSILAIIVGLICTYIFIFFIPKLRWKRWRYEIFEQEIYIQHGLLIVSRTLVPMIRVQHVDTKQGPILRKFSLASVTISTAATTHEIPALVEEDASELRDRISHLAMVDDVDV